MPTPTTLSTFSEEDWLAVSPEHVFHRGANLIERAVHTGTIEDERHQILRSAGCFAQGSKSTLDERRVALRSHLRHSLLLLALRLLRNLEQLDLQLRLFGDEVVHADDHAPVLFDLPLLTSSRFVDAALKPAGLQTSHD